KGTQYEVRVDVEKRTNEWLVGFAAETTNPIDYGKEKLQKKNVDAIVVNDVSLECAGFEGDRNIATYMNKQVTRDEIPLASKDTVAEKILHFIHRDLEDGFE